MALATARSAGRNAALADSTDLDASAAAAPASEKLDEAQLEAARSQAVSSSASRLRSSVLRLVSGSVPDVTARSDAGSGGRKELAARISLCRSWKKEREPTRRAGTWSDCVTSSKAL